MEPNRSHHTRHRVRLPSGKQIEVVYRDQNQPAAPAASGAGAPGAPTAPDSTCVPDPLHICFHCAGDLVYPLDWIEEGPRHWRIVLRCPECESRREGVFEQATVQELDEELDRAAGALLSDLQQLTQANMEDEVEFFVRALDADLIVPSDF
ncbi:MAG TPA: hypothetical protein VMU55_00255 [Solirubrobacteraceae bacterium]|nr:hypothetical protein [Solirubrobacteraceae bacterium]